MKLAMVYVTRGHSTSLITSVNSAWRLRSGNSPIRFYLRFDSDDSVAKDAAAALYDSSIPITAIVRPKPDTLGAAFNETVQIALADGCDIVSSFADDVMPAALGWDEFIRHWANQSADFFSWNDLAMPGVVTCPIMSDRWIKTIGQFMPEWFPFWFADTWVQEVYFIAAGRPAPIVGELKFVPSADPARTKNMRDFQFWVDFWIATQSVRIADGQRAAAALGWPEQNIEALKPALHGRSAWNVDAIQDMRGTTDAPGVQYQRAKAKAENWLEQNRNN